MSQEIQEELLVDTASFHQKKLTLSAGSQTPKHHHQLTHETYIVIEGTGKIIVGGKVHDVTPGSFVDIPIHAPHQVVNNELLPLIVISTKNQPQALKDFYLDS